jgi:hypothetical protein
MKRLILVVVFAVLLIAALPAFAQVSTISGTITGSTGFIENYNFDCEPYNDGYVYFYEVYVINVSVAGTYQFRNTGIFEAAPAFYVAPGFDVSAPTANCIGSFAGDYAITFPSSGNYTMVVSTFVDNTTGDFSFTLEGAGVVAIVTASSATCANPLPAGSVVYAVPAGAPAFFAADLATQINLTLPAGTWWISEFRGDFAKVWIACSANPIWIPANAVAR